MGRFQKHRDKWNECDACSLHEKRRKVVLGRGKIPCDLMFVGEGPGASEDRLGRPFIGPAGKILDRIIEQSVTPGLSCFFTNLVACIPLNEESRKTVAPPVKCIRKCGPRLEEVWKIAKPKLIVCVGTLAQKWVPEIVGPDEAYVHIVHPGKVLKMGKEQQSFALQQATITLGDAVEDHF